MNNARSREPDRDGDELRLADAAPTDATAPTPDDSCARGDEAPTAGIAGERGTSLLFRARSLQARIGNVLAIAFVAVLGLSLLGWYYARTWSRTGDTQHAARAQVQARAEGEQPLPALGPIDPPAVERVLGPPPPEPPPDLPDPWRRPASVPDAPSAVPGGAKTPEQLALARRLSGPVSVGRPDPAAAGSATPYIRSEGDPVDTHPGPAGLAARLQPTATPAALARLLPTQQLLLPKGAFIDCTLETAINSALPGLTTCITATDTFSADGTVVLLERGTKLVGETVGTVQRGAARIFVLWTEARTPTGVVIPLASPGTDELGRAGLAGRVNRHFFERFGAAILITVIDGAVQAAVASQRAGDATVIYNPSTSQDILTEVLRGTLDIPPTVDKDQGDRIQVLVARDLDFRSVYELRATR